MIEYVEIRQVFRARLLTVPGIPVHRAWENRTFTPPDPPADWLRETLFPVSERRNAANVVEAVGITQYDFFTPASRGTEAIETLVDNVRLAFKPTTALTADLLLDRAERGSATQEPDWFHIPVRLLWRAYSVNA
jgi:hypothetical protein